MTTLFHSRVNALAGFPTLILYGSPRWPSWSEWEVPFTSEPATMEITEQDNKYKTVSATLSDDEIHDLVIQAVASHISMDWRKLKHHAELFDYSGGCSLTAKVPITEE